MSELLAAFIGPATPNPLTIAGLALSLIGAALAVRQILRGYGA